MAFPTEELMKKFKLFWQYPAITEKTFYIQNKDNNNLFSMPWATIIDKEYNMKLLRKELKKVDWKEVGQKISIRRKGVYKEYPKIGRAHV